jgi:carboxyl-terminal processing protease
MPKLNYYIILFSLFFYVFFYQITIRDRILFETFHRIERQALSPPESRKLFEGAMNGMFKTLDSYSYYTPAAGKKDYNDHLDNHYNGIGLVSAPLRDKKTVEIIYPLVDSPVFLAGLRSGDQILAVNDNDLTDEQVNDFSSLIKKLDDAEISLTALPFGKTEPVKVKIKKAPLDMDSVEGDSIDSNGVRNFVLEHDNETGYIRITSFSRRTADEFSDALRQLYKKQAKGLILDLRNNPGGYVNVSVEIATMLLEATGEATIIVSTKFRDGTVKKIYYGNEKNQICSLPIVVIIDGDTASASEILAAALQDYKRAVVVGARSFGKGVVQEIYDLPANSGTYQLTGVSYWRPSNKNINRTKNATETDEWGVIPDVECKLELNKWRSRAINSIRTRRANAICENRNLFLNTHVENVEHDIEYLRNEVNKLKKKNKTENAKTNEITENNDKNTNIKPEISDKNNKITPTEKNINDVEFENETENFIDEICDSDEEIDTPFKLQGEPPYFDPQLDKAIEILKQLISGKTVAEVVERQVEQVKRQVEKVDGQVDEPKE